MITKNSQKFDIVIKKLQYYCIMINKHTKKIIYKQKYGFLLMMVLGYNALEIYLRTNT